MTRTPKIASSASSGTTTYGVRSRSSSRLETTKPIAPPACWRFAGVAEPGLRAAVGDVHDAEHAERQRRPADDLTAGRAVVLGVAQVAPADVDQQQRDEPADLADRAGDHGAGAVHDRAGQLPPDRGGGDHRETEQEQARRRRGGARARGRGRCARCERAVAPRAWAMPSQTVATPCPRAAKSRASGPGPLRTARGAGRGPGWACASTSSAFAWPGCRYSGIGCSSSSWPRCSWTRSCSANPAGKTYGSPCSGL